MAGQLATRASLVVQRISVLNVGRLTRLANSQIELVIAGYVLQEIPGPFEAELRCPVQQNIGFKCTTHAVPIFDIRSGPAGMYLVGRIDSQQQASRKEGYKCRCLQLIARILDEPCNLLGRFSTAAFDRIGARVAEIGRVKFADPVITEPGALPDGACPRLVPDHSKGEFELGPFGGIAIVGETHLFLFMLVNAHIQ